MAKENCRKAEWRQGYKEKHYWGPTREGSDLNSVFHLELVVKKDISFYGYLVYVDRIIGRYTLRAKDLKFRTTFWG